MEDFSEIKVNIVSLASNLAHKELENFYTEELFIESDSEELIYTERAQKIFNKLYDKYYNIILNCSVN